MKRLLITGRSSEIGMAVSNLAVSRGWFVVHPQHSSLDVSNEDSVIRYFDSTAPFDALVNAASFHQRIGLMQQPVNVTVDTILKGSFYCIREFVNKLSDRQGAIVNVSSESARTGGRRLSAYVAAKAGVNALTLALSRELAPNIRINTVSLGVIDTAANSDKDGAELPFGRKGTPLEVAYAVLWLLSDEASYVSGAILPIAGAH